MAGSSFCDLEMLELAVILFKNGNEMAELLCKIEDFDLQKWMLSQVEQRQASYYKMRNGRVVELAFRY